MQMRNIGSLFERYQKILVPPQASVEKLTAEIICDLTPLQVRADQVTYSVATKTLSLQIPSILKSELHQYKETILQQLQKELGIKNCPKTIL